jgi:hypothetical protein
LNAVRHWLTLGVMACAAAFAGQPPTPSPPAPPPPDAARAATPVVDPPAVDAPGADAPDDEFIEFLGADDVGDAAWWAFLKKSALRKDSTSTTPPQDAKQ